MIQRKSLVCSNGIDKVEKGCFVDPGPGPSRPPDPPLAVALTRHTPLKFFPSSRKRIYH